MHGTSVKKNSASWWFMLYGYITMHGQENTKSESVLTTYIPPAITYWLFYSSLYRDSTVLKCDYFFLSYFSLLSTVGNSVVTVVLIAISCSALVLVSSFSFLLAANKVESPWNGTTSLVSRVL